MLTFTHKYFHVITTQYLPPNALINIDFVHISQTYLFVVLHKEKDNSSTNIISIITINIL